MAECTPGRENYTQHMIERMRNKRVGQGRMQIVVSGSFTARHNCVEDQPHEHTWHVTAYFAGPPRADARLYRTALDVLLERWNGTTLPADADWNEDIAATVASLVNCVEVHVWREADRLGVRWPG